jgi:hypothetical protein
MSIEREDSAEQKEAAESIINIPFSSPLSHRFCITNSGERKVRRTWTDSEDSASGFNSVLTSEAGARFLKQSSFPESPT